jgi:hypothetical protein
MKESKIQLFCTVLISISIVIGCVWIGFSIRYINKDVTVSETSSSITNKGLMTEEETAIYLSLSQDNFDRLIAYEDSQRTNVSDYGYDTYSFIPYVKIDNVKYFNKEQVDKWVEYNMVHRREINTY